MENQYTNLQIFVDSCKALNKEIKKFPTVIEWWQKTIIIPAIKSSAPKFIALFVIEFLIYYTKNWVAFLLCMTIIFGFATNIYNYICESLRRGINALMLDLYFSSGYYEGVKAKENTSTTEKP
jgi:hypothetical protein